MLRRLTAAFREKNTGAILKLSAEIGHYIADAHVPLHATSNHNGQLTQQEGIHAFWEAQLPELFGKNYNLNTGEAHYISNIEKATWAAIDSSHSKVKSLLLIESKMKKE